MTEPDPSMAVRPRGGEHDIHGRTVAAGRGWNWITEGYALFRKQPGIWILAAVVLGVIFIVISMVPLLGTLANALLFPIFGAGLMLGCRDLDQGGKLEIDDLFAGFKQKTGDLVMVGAFNLLGWVVIAFTVFVVVGGSVFMGMMRGEAPGVDISLAPMLIAMLLVAGLSLPLYMATWFAPALIVLGDAAPGAALKASFYACLSNWLPFLLYGIVLFLLCLVAVIPAGLGFLVLMPVVIASVYTAYRDIFEAVQ